VSGVAEIRKAIGGAVVAVATAAYAVLNADGFDFQRVGASQWESVALAGFGAFTAVYHLRNADTVPPVSADLLAWATSSDTATPADQGGTHAA